jgi:hypothetical protein
MRGEVKEVYAFGLIVYINGLKPFLFKQRRQLINTSPYHFFSPVFST